MRNINWDSVQEASESKSLPVGGYVCGIFNAVDVPEKEYLNICWDVVEGEYKWYFKEMTKSLIERGKLNRNEWAYGGVTKKSYKEKALPFFKAFLTSVEQSNQGYKFNNDESTLRGKYVGIVLGEEEYMGTDGSVKTKLVVSKFTSVEKIREGDFVVPPKKLLSASNIGNAPISYAAVSAEEDLPF